MDFYPFFRGPYYYTQNRYMNQAYRNMQKRGEYNGQNLGGQTSKSAQKSDNLINENKSQSREFNKKSNVSSKYGESPIFEIFGIKLFFDDILIISLIFFLYNEGVRDNLLFISLILILLS